MTDVDQDAIVEYCGMYYRMTREGLFEMFRTERENFMAKMNWMRMSLLI